MRADRIDESAKIVRLHLRARILLQHRVGGIEIQSELVLDVDDEGVDLGRIGNADQMLQTTRVGREAKDVKTACGKRSLDQRVEHRWRRMLPYRNRCSRH